MPILSWIPEAVQVVLAPALFTPATYILVVSDAAFTTKPKLVYVDDCQAIPSK